jgi:RepB DNA-primase from phage plasmid
MVDLACAARFLSLLDDTGVFTFQTFADAEGQSVATRPRVLHGSLDEHAAQLTDLNDSGAGVFVMVNAGDGVAKAGARTCRTVANVQRVRAVFVDLDGAPIAPVLASALPPDWVVQSSLGRWHAYWRVNDCPLERFEAVQAALATRFDGDTKVKDLPRVMRVPGFFHRKADPFRSELWEPTSYSKVMEMNHE